MAITDPIEWRLLDTDFTTVLAILPSDGGNYSVELNEPAAGELKIPLESSAADLVTEGMFIECRYRGASRGGFLVDNINPVNANQMEGGGQWVSLSGRGALALLDDAIIWNDNTGNTSREFTGTKAGILITLIDEAKARGCFPNLTYDFSATLDSESVAWTDNESLTLPVGESLLDVLRQFADTGVDFDINLSGGNFVLSAYKNGKGDVLSTVYFRIGTNCEEVSEKNIGMRIKNVFQMKYRDGFALVTDPTSISAYRRREKNLSIEAAQTVASATTYGSAKLANEKDPQKAIDVRVFDDVKPYIFEDYDLGDYIILDRFGVEESRRVRGFRLSFDESGTAHVIVNLNSILMENEMRMGRDLNWLLNQWNTAKDAKKLEVSFWAAIGDPNITYAPNDLKIIGSNLYVTNGTNLLIYNIANGGWARIVAPVTLYRMTNVGTDLYITGTAGTLYKYSGGTFTLVGTVLNTSDPGGSFILSITAIGTKVYISGIFDEVNSVSTTGVAEYDTVGNTWADIGGGFATAEEMTTDGSILYVGAAGQVKQWNGSWSNLGSAFGASLTAIAVYNDNLLAACADTGKIFEWDGSTWAVFGGGVNGWVNAIGVYLTDVYVGGAFTDVGSRIAKYSGGQWWILDGGVNATVTRLVLDATDLYVSGASITLAGDKVVQGIAAYFTNFNSLTNYLENTTGTFNLGEAIHNATAKSPMVAADEMPLWDSITEQLRKITWSNILLSIKTYADSLYVALTGNQTVAGIKTFSSFPVTPSSAPTTDYQVANKKYVDDNAGGGGTPGGSDTQVQYNNGGTFDGFGFWDALLEQLWIGGQAITGFLGKGLGVIGEGGATDVARIRLFHFGTQTSGAGMTTAGAGGTRSAPTATTNGTILGQWGIEAWFGNNEADHKTIGYIRAVVTDDHATGDQPFQWEIYTCPSGSDTPTLAMTITSDGHINISSGKEYQVNGSQHQHVASDITSGTMATARLGSGTANGSTFLSGDQTYKPSGLSVSSSSVTTGNITGVQGTLHNLDVSGMTANRDFNLPTPTAAGFRCGVRLATGDDRYALILKANSVEQTRLFITGEVVIFVSTGTGAGDWIIEHDGRKASGGRISNSVAQTINHATPTKIVFDTQDDNNNGMADVTNDVILIRRTGRYAVSGTFQMDSGVVYTRILGNITKNAWVEIARFETDSASTGIYPVLSFVSVNFTFAAGDTIDMNIYQENGGAANKNTVAGTAHLEAVEIL